MNTKKVTMSDIARECEVSQTTVSMILNHRLGTFPPETVQKVTETATRMGYIFRAKKQSGYRNVVMVITTSTTNPYYAEMVQSIDQAAREQSVQIVTACTYHNMALEGQLLQTAIDSSFLGVIFLYPPDNIDAYEAALEQTNVVALGNRIRRIKGDFIQIDNFEAGSVAARHLLELGHRRIAVITRGSQSNATSGANRLAGIIAEMEKELSRDDLLIISDNSTSDDLLYTHHVQYEIGYRLAQDPRIYSQHVTGIICTNDLNALGVMDYLTTQGYRVPEDFSVIGSDNLRYSAMPQINLTTVDLHMDTVATAAFSTLLNRSLLQRSSGSVLRSSRMQLRCSVDLIVRGSTAPARTVES